MSTKYDAIVIGAGFSGAAFARVMADSGKKVLILEKRPHIGGNSYDENINGILVHKYGPHIFHTNNMKVFKFLKRFSGWYKYEHHVIGKIDGKFVPIPFNFASIDILFDEKSADNIKEKLCEYFGRNTKISILNVLNHHDSKIRNFGRFVYDKVFVNYTAKQWGTSIDKVDLSTINRVPIVIGYDNRYFSDSIQVMPKEGFTNLFENMLNSKNITLELNTNAKERICLDFDKNKIKFDNIDYNGIIFFTGAVDELLNAKYGRLPYRSLRLFFENIDSEFYQPNSVVNYPNEEKWTRITEFKHFMPGISLKKLRQTIILKEYPLPPDSPEAEEPYYPVINEANIKLHNEYSRLLSGFGSVYICGRLAEYKYYNMDEAVAKALELARQVKQRHGTLTGLMLLKEIFLYGLIGTCCASLDSAVFMLIRKAGMPLYASNFISINLGIFSSFLLNTFLNFKTKDKLKIRAVQFFIVGYCGLMLSMAILFVGMEILLFKETFVKVMSVFIVAGFQFTFNKLFTFRKKQYG